MAGEGFTEMMKKKKKSKDSWPSFLGFGLAFAYYWNFFWDVFNLDYKWKLLTGGLVCALGAWGGDALYEIYKKIKKKNRKYFTIVLVIVLLLIFIIPLFFLR